MIEVKENERGFDWGALSVQRMDEDERRGSVVLSLNTPQETLQIYVDRNGKVKVLSLDQEWKKVNTRRR